MSRRWLGVLTLVVVDVASAYFVPEARRAFLLAFAAMLGGAGMFVILDVVTRRHRARPKPQQVTFFGMRGDVDLPSGWRAVGAVAVVRAIDASGQRRIVTVYAGDVMAWEALAMVEVAEDDVRGHLALDVPRLHKTRG